MLEIRKLTLLGAVACGILFLSSYLAYPQIKFSQSPNCEANPGWTTCSDAKDAGLGFIIFGTFGIAASYSILRLEPLKIEAK